TLQARQRLPSASAPRGCRGADQRTPAPRRCEDQSGRCSPPAAALDASIPTATASATWDARRGGCAAASCRFAHEGLLTVLLRLVFVLYAEDRDLLPSLNEPHAKDVYEKSYSLRGLYAKLVEDAALHPDTMDERRGAWGRLLALFRLIHGGHRSHFIQARGGKLFDPDVFPFIEGRQIAADRPKVLDVSDGCILRILEGLMTLK